MKKLKEIQFIPRQDMPQIHDKDYPHLFHHLGKHGVVLKLCERDPRSLKFHQRVLFDPTVKPDPRNLAKPLLIAADGYILDGNHRACRHQMEGSQAPCIELDREFEDAFELLYSFKNTYFEPGLVAGE